jgi:hypothetical protein
MTEHADQMLGDPQVTDAMPEGAAGFIPPEPGAMPSLEGQPEDQQPDYAAMLAAERAEKEQARREAEELRQYRAQFEQARQQMAFQQAAQAWEQRKQQLKQQLEPYDTETREQFITAFYESQMQQMAQAAQQQNMMLMANGWADQVLREHGLAPEDRMLLGEDPNQYQARAQRIAEDRRQHNELLENIQRQQRAQQAQQRVEAGVNRIGGVGGRPAPVGDNIERGSRDHLRALLTG